jgi:hypothetical protein
LLSQQLRIGIDKSKVNFVIEGLLLSEPVFLKVEADEGEGKNGHEHHVPDHHV